jgi:hypothetical protein
MYTLCGTKILIPCKFLPHLHLIEISKPIKIFGPFNIGIEISIPCTIYMQYDLLEIGTLVACQNKY